MTNPTFSIADLAAMIAGVLADEPYDMDEDYAAQALGTAFDAEPTGPFNGLISSVAYMITRHASYTTAMRDEFISRVHDEIAAMYEED